MLPAYKIPRQPSTPRIAIWRKFERLGVARLGDGLAGLPADARTREQLEWIAEEILEAHGSAMVWLAEPASVAQERPIARAMRAAWILEYRAVMTKRVPQPRPHPANEPAPPDGSAPNCAGSTAGTSSRPPSARPPGRPYTL